MISFRCRSRKSSGPAHEIPSEKDRFSRPKSFPYTSGIASVFGWRNTVKNGASVTISHLFWTNQRRKAAFPLPIWLRNSPVLAWTRQLPGGGVSRADAVGGLDPKGLTEFYA
jgi:hypothetical protein